MTYTVKVTYEDGTIWEATYTDYVIACCVLGELTEFGGVGEIIEG
jgi:hypothetical protein